MKIALFFASFLAITVASVAQIYPIRQHAIEQKAHVHQGVEGCAFHLEVDEMRSMWSLASKGSETMAPTLLLAMPDGREQIFEVEESSIMAPELAARYPQIQTYRIENGDSWGRISLTEKGFHGMVFTDRGTVYIDPMDALQGTYFSYYRADYKRAFAHEKPHYCLQGDEPSDYAYVPSANRGSGRGAGELRTYRLALACTGEYATYHGGTVSGALSAMVVTMNRVNGLYERDVAIHMELIANNDDLIFLNASTDPYTNNNGGTMLNQNQNTVNNIIGSSNYDIGHVFSTGGGGIASLGCVCSSNNKARGVTGSSAPTGDAFDIDYVAHEMGHQFGGEHTFNATSGSCGGGNREASAAYEPGSGSTIMAYAGICGASDNLQNNSDDYFHSYSVEQIIQFSQNGNGNSCASITNTNNSAPVVTVPNGGFTIPMGTPFVLKGSATDANDNSLTYCWEEMDLGQGGAMNSPSGNAPIFRSWDPKTVDERTCPRMVSVITGSLVAGELYPSYSRDMTFRLTVRDQNSSAAAISWEEVSFEVDGDAGPFEVTAPTGGSVQAGAGFEVTWDVAGTDAAPINCENVVIELCTYVTATQSLQVVETLSSSTPNDGSEVVVAQNMGGSRYVRVRAADNIFFNIGPATITVSAPQPLEDAGIPLTATPDYTASTVALNWTDSFSNEGFWVIERSLGGNQSFVAIDSLGPDATSYTDLNAVMTGNNYYRVYAGNGAGNSDYSNLATYAPLHVLEVQDGDVHLYPVPATNTLFMQLPAAHGFHTGIVYNAIGEPVRTVVITGKSVVAVNVQDLPAGKYWMQFKGTKADVLVRPFQVVH